MSKRGRPKLTERAAHEEAARVINVAHALRYHPDALPALGFLPTRRVPSTQKALRYVSKRRRGLIGELIGASVRRMLFPVVNRTEIAAALVLDHGLTLYRAAKLAEVDLPNLKRAVRQRQEAQVQAYPRPLILSVQVEDLS
jgi:hypothetical protein